MEQLCNFVIKVQEGKGEKEEYERCHMIFAGTGRR